MTIFDDADRTSVFRGKFASELADLAGAELVYMGFFDIDARAFLDGWAGIGSEARQPGMGARVASAGADVTAILKDLPDDDGSLADNQVLYSDGYAISVGAIRGHLVPVMAVCGSHDAGACLQLGLSYVTQQMGDVLADAPQARDQALQTALDVLSIHLAVVDPYGEIDFSTDLSQDWLDQYGGFEITLNRLSGKTQQMQKALHQALTRATGPDREGSIVPIDDSDKRLSRIAVVLPMEKSDPPRALVILEQGDKDPELAEHLLKLSGLTNSECRIAHHLLDGKSLNEIAEETNLSLSTVRSYLKGIFAKTHTHRQGQFITYFYNTLPRVKNLSAIADSASKQAR